MVGQRCTRGARGRGRVRTRGGVGRGQQQQVDHGVGQAVVVQRRECRRHGGSSGGRPVTLDELNIVWAEDLPRGEPLERPLQPKRRRSMCPTGEAAGSSSASVERVDTEPAAMPPSPATFVESACGSQSSPGSAVSQNVGSPALLPSPAMFEECAASGSPVVSSRSSPGPSTRRLTEEEIMFQYNYGSESDSDSGDDVLPPMMVPRTFQLALETPDDADRTETEYDLDDITAPTAAYHPHDMFDFEWKPFPDSPIQRESRREPFSDRNVGPTTTFDDPYSAFTAIWDRQIVEHVAVETNRYAQDTARHMLALNRLQPTSRICEWRDTDADELYIYFAIVLAMGVVIKSKLEEYWSTSEDIFITPGFRALMSLRRFQLLNKCIHFNNNQNMSALELDAADAKLYKIEPLLSHINKKYQALYNLGQNIALDESLLQWKGWLSINQLLPNKKARIGIKSYEICESSTGYLWRFEIDAHQKATQQWNDPMSATIPAIVLRLTQGLENKGHTLWMDNFYNSPALARRLKSVGFDCVGTLRTNRQFVPEALNNLSKGKMRPGQFTGFTSGDVDVMVWRDQDRVATISTYHGNAVNNVSGAAKPIVILDYNVMMGGVDKKDQMLAMYPIERKRTKVWYKKLFRRVLNVSVLNAYILFRHTHASTEHRAFRASLINSLVDKHTVKSIVIPPLFPRRIYEVKHHHLAEYPFLGKKRVERLRRVCVICKKRGTMYCIGCAKTVCLDPCFVKLHE